MSLRKAPLVFLAALSCTGQDAGEADLVPRRGSLIQEWTINGERSTAVCERARAARVRVVVYDFEGEEATELAPCTDFRLRVVLWPGIYGANATLLDASGQALSATHEVADLELEDDEEVVRSVDFVVPLAL